MKIFLAHQIMNNDHASEEMRDAVVYGTSAHATMEAAKLRVKDMLGNEYDESLWVRVVDQTDGEVREEYEDDSDDTYVIREVEI